MKVYLFRFNYKFLITCTNIYESYSRKKDKFKEKEDIRRNIYK